jgi:hypothetical protein
VVRSLELDKCQRAGSVGLAGPECPIDEVRGNLDSILRADLSAKADLHRSIQPVRAEPHYENCE